MANKDGLTSQRMAEQPMISIPESPSSLSVDCFVLKNLKEVEYCAIIVVTREILRLVSSV
jgi:hypothetical protein